MFQANLYLTRKHFLVFITCITDERHWRYLERLSLCCFFTSSKVISNIRIVLITFSCIKLPKDKLIYICIYFILKFHHLIPMISFPWLCAKTPAPAAPGTHDFQNFWSRLGGSPQKPGDCSSETGYVAIREFHRDAACVSWWLTENQPQGGEAKWHRDVDWWREETTLTQTPWTRSDNIQSHRYTSPTAHTPGPVLRRCGHRLWALIRSRSAFIHKLIAVHW